MPGLSNQQSVVPVGFSNVCETSDVSPVNRTAPNTSSDSGSSSRSTFESAQAFVAGGVGGVCSVLVGHPFDLVKVRLQTAEKGAYSGAIDVVRKSIAHDGIKGLYAGVSAPLVGVTPMFAVSFWGYDLGKQLVRAMSPSTSSTFTPAEVAMAGFISAIPMTLVTAPFERVKVILQIQGQKQESALAVHSQASSSTSSSSAPSNSLPAKPAPAKYTGAFDVVRKLYGEGGIRSVFRGGAMTFARDGPGSAAYFATYEIIKRKLSHDASGYSCTTDRAGPVNCTSHASNPNSSPPSQLSFGAICVAGGAAGIAMWIPVFPIDTIKSRLQSSETRLSVSHVISAVYTKGGGIKAFYPGFAPAVARAVPANAAAFVGVEFAQKMISSVFG